MWNVIIIEITAISIGCSWLSLNISPRNKAYALHLCTTVLPTVGGGDPLYLSETIGIMCRGTRARQRLFLPLWLVRTSYNRCSYVPLTRRATITLMHCPMFRRLTTRRPHRRFALSQIELNRITGSRALKSLSCELHCRSYPAIHRLSLSRNWEIKHFDCNTPHTMRALRC